ncbi:MAG: PAS domain-containing sensor histidine kinase [Flavobacteriaceae bacterium]|nr:PAS domain-containing sensor histidine kinase [Flavobacteriaceae bacterium]
MKNSSSSFNDVSPFDNFYYKEIAKLNAAGGWSVNFVDKVSFLDPEGRRILKTPDDFRPSLKNALDFYAPDHKELAAGYFMACSNGEAFSTTIKMATFEGNVFWAKAMGTPVFNEEGEIIGIQGVFQDVNEEKLKEIRLQKSIKVIESQNSRLFNFAHIVSHNLRSHASNLHLTLELLKSIDNKTDEEELKDSLYTISENLNNTINHLNEIVSAQSKSLSERKTISFEKTLDNVSSSINRMISDAEAEIYSDFSEVPEIDYLPSYMDSIFLNLLTNAIKYRHPDRSPVIDICTFKENGEVTLMIKDNGLGIDLEKHGDKVFNMYQTFHEGKESVGIGLFITKNQIETLQGRISIESKVDIGTTFKIVF